MKIKELKEMIKNAFIAEETNAEYFYEPMEEINANDSLNEVDDIDFVANLEAELAEGLYEAKYEDIDPETKEILNSLEGLRAKADDEKFETLLNTIVTMVRQYMYGDRKLNIGALKAAIEKGDFASLLKFQKTPNPGNPYMAEDLYEAEEEEQTDVTIDAEEETTNSRRRNNKKKSSDDSIVVGKKIVKLSSLSDEKQDILNSLETLRAQAEEFGDGKFETQVGNTITFFNRDFVVGGDKPTKEKVDESLEILRMRKLAGLLKEGEYAKALLKEYEEPAFDNASGLPPDFAQAQYDYEMEKSRDPFRESETNEAESKGFNVDDYPDEDDDLIDLNKAFKASPDKLPYDKVLDIIKSYEDESILDDFKSEFPEGEDISKEDYSDFSIALIDDMSEVSYIQANWIGVFDDSVYEKAGLV